MKEIWESDLKVVFVATAVEELSETLGFYHLHPRNRFWEFLELGGVTPTRIITPSERKALADGHAQGSLSEPVRWMFVQKKTSQLLKLGIGPLISTGEPLSRATKTRMPDLLRRTSGNS